jgi:hypothetical protein
LVELMTIEPLTGTVTFHGPFLVSSGLSAQGVDLRSRTDAKVPAASIKGVMRAAARDVLGISPELIAQVFGVPGTEGVWAWTHAGSGEDFVVWTRTRNRLDSATHMTVDEALAVTDEVYAKRPLPFRIEPIGPVTDEQRLLLVASAFAVTSIGSGRNRGMGAVTVRLDHPISAADLVEFVTSHRRPA